MNLQSVRQLAARRTDAIEGMIASMLRGEAREYAVALVGYFVEGIPYAASGLEVGPAATPGFARTPRGFTCTAFFPPALVRPNTVRRNGIIHTQIGADSNEAVKVQLDVRSDDIWALTELEDGAAHDLFIDPEAFLARTRRFHREVREWVKRAWSRSTP